MFLNQTFSDAVESALNAISVFADFYFAYLKCIWTNHHINVYLTASIVLFAVSCKPNNACSLKLCVILRKK